MGFIEGTTGSKMNGLWFVVGMCVLGALLTLALKRGAEKADPKAVAIH
jgi:hypothetical protein